MPQQQAKSTAKKQSGAQKAAKQGGNAKRRKNQTVNRDERQRLIAESAYLIAEKRGFQGGNAMDDWLKAEAEVDAKFAAMH